MINKRGIIFIILFVALFSFAFVNAAEQCPDSSTFDFTSCDGDCCYITYFGSIPFCNVIQPPNCGYTCDNDCSYCSIESECSGSDAGCIWDNYPELYGGRCEKTPFTREICYLDEDDDWYIHEDQYNFSGINGDCGGSINCHDTYSSSGPGADNVGLCEKDARCQLSGGTPRCIDTLPSFSYYYRCDTLTQIQCGAASVECSWTGTCEPTSYPPIYEDYHCSSYLDDETACTILPYCKFIAETKCENSNLEGKNFISEYYYSGIDCNDESSCANPSFLTENQIFSCEISDGCEDNLDNDCDGGIDLGDNDCTGGTPPGGWDPDADWMSYSPSSPISYIEFKLSDLPTGDIPKPLDSSNSVKIRTTNTGMAQGDTVSFEIWRMNDEFPEEYVKTINAIVDSSGQANATWQILQEDVTDNYGNLLQGGNIDFFFKVKDDALGRIKSFAGIKNLNMIIINDPPLPSPGNGDWMDYSLTQTIDYIKFDLLNLLAGGDSSPENSVKIIFADNTALGPGDNVHFKIYRHFDESSEIFLKTISGTLNLDEQAIVTWTVNEEDLEAINGLEGGVFDFHFKVEDDSGLIADFSNRVLTMNITTFNPNNLVGQWLDFGNHVISEISFWMNNLPLTIGGGKTPGAENTVKIKAGSIPDGMVVDVEIWEKDLLNKQPIRTSTVNGVLTGTVINNEIIIPWTVTQEDIENAGSENTYEFFFKVIVEGETIEFDDVILDMTIIDADEPWAYWANLDGGQINIFYYPYEDTVNLVINNSGLGEGSVSFEIWESDDGSGEGTEDDEIRTVIGTVDEDGVASASWTMTQENFDDAGEEPDDIYEFYFKVNTFDDSYILYTTYGHDPIICEDINECKDYGLENPCDNDDCEVANNSAHPGTVDCSNSEIDCFCYWQDENCHFGFNGLVFPGENQIGTCSYVEDMQGANCDEGQSHYSYSWVANWDWGGNNYVSKEKCVEAWNVILGEGVDPNDCIEEPEGLEPEQWHYNPYVFGEGDSRYSALCKNGSGLGLCPVKVQLPFGTWINWIIALVIILVIYYLIVNSRQRKGEIEKEEGE